MSTVQLAIHNERYAAALADLLYQDGAHEVLFVDRPDLGVDGIIVVDGNRTEDLLLVEKRPERFVVVARKDPALLSRIWDAGVRHVVFEGDSPATTLLAVVAAELRSPRQIGAQRTLAAVPSRADRNLLPKFPVPVLDSRNARLRCCFPANKPVI